MTKFNFIAISKSKNKELLTALRRVSSGGQRAIFSVILGDCVAINTQSGNHRREGLQPLSRVIQTRQGGVQCDMHDCY